MNALTYEDLKLAVSGKSAAFRSVVELQPAGGPGDKVFPPTYEGGKYATEKRRLNGELVDSVLIDSVQSQANRIEAALLDAWQHKTIGFPMILVDFNNTVVPEVGRISTLETPHRIADAILRDSLLKDIPFRASEVGKCLNDVSNRNSTALYKLCPVALILGMWDSTGPRGGGGAKFARALVSEIIGIGVVQGVKTSSRIDPLQIMKQAGPIYKMPNGDWTLDEKRAAIKDKKAVVWGKEGKPSEINHGNVTPSVNDGGVTIDKAIQTSVLSLPALRRLRFPLNDQPESDNAVDNAARTVLAALGLCAIALTCEQGYDLRSRCLLVPTHEPQLELIGKPGEPVTAYSLDSRSIIDIYKEAVNDAAHLGLRWSTEPVVLQPKPELAQLVKKSRELAAKTGAEEA
jgi:CRISPR-associated protein Csb1